MAKRSYPQKDLIEENRGAVAWRQVLHSLQVLHIHHGRCCKAIPGATLARLDRARELAQRVWALSREGVSKAQLAVFILCRRLRSSDPKVNSTPPRRSRPIRSKCHKAHCGGTVYVQCMTDASHPARPPRHFVQALWRGLAQRCPSCGAGQLFARYLKVRDQCPACGEALHHHRADDAPAYFTILLVGHIVVGGVLALERGLSPPTWVQLAIWLPLTLLGCLFLLPRVKGALVALQWALYMHGFEPTRAPEPCLERGEQARW